MAPIQPVIDAFKRLRTQTIAFRNICAVRGFHARSKHTNVVVRHPDWQLFAVIAITLIGLGFLFVDGAAGHWKSTIPPEVYGFFREFTRLGKSEMLLVPAAIAVLALGLFPWKNLSRTAKATLSQFQMLGLYVFIAIAGSGITNNLIKMAIGRARPRHFDDLGPFHFDAPGLSSGFQSFPSGHSATAGAMAVIFILIWPRLKWTWIGVAFWIALSRVVVGAHYPSDTVAGLAYGAAFAWLLALWFTKRRLLFRAQDGLIRIPKTSGLSLGKLYKALHMMRQKA